jgi:hypothetical protein
LQGRRQNYGFRGKLGRLQFRRFIVIQGSVVEEQGIAERSASISFRTRTMSNSFSRKTTFTSFTLTSGDGSLLLPIQDSARAEIIWQTWDP